MNSYSTFLIYTCFWFDRLSILSKLDDANNFESHNCLNLIFTNIRGLRSNFVRFESHIESNGADISELICSN